MVNPVLISGAHAVFVGGDDAATKQQVAEVLRSFGVERWRHHRPRRHRNITWYRDVSGAVAPVDGRSGNRPFQHSNTARGQRTGLDSMCRAATRRASTGRCVDGGVGVMGSARGFDKGQKLFNAHDLEGIVEIYSQDAVATGPGAWNTEDGMPSRSTPRAGCRAFPTRSSRDTNVIEAGDTIVEEGVFTGTHTGIFPTPMEDIPPTGEARRKKFRRHPRHPGWQGGRTACSSTASS